MVHMRCIMDMSDSSETAFDQENRCCCAGCATLRNRVVFVSRIIVSVATIMRHGKSFKTKNDSIEETFDGLFMLDRVPSVQEEHDIQRTFSTEKAK